MKRFNIKAMISESLLGDVPDGTRIDLEYSSGTITFTNEESATTYDCKVVSGHDWALVRTDAVCIFDGTANATLSATIEGKKTEVPLILGVEGRADLLEIKLADGSHPKSKLEAIARWRAGFGKGAELPVVVSVSVTIDNKAPDELKDLLRPVFWGSGLYKFLADQYVELSLDGLAASDVALPPPSPATHGLPKDGSPKSIVVSADSGGPSISMQTVTVPQSTAHRLERQR